MKADLGGPVGADHKIGDKVFVATFDASGRRTDVYRADVIGISETHARVRPESPNLWQTMRRRWVKLDRVSSTGPK